MKTINFTWQLSVIYYDKETCNDHREKYLNEYGNKTTTEYDYPLEVDSFEFGFFSSRKKAEQFIISSIIKEEFTWFYNENVIKYYFIACYETDTGNSEMINGYVYNPDGSFYDGSLIEEIQDANNHYHFPGRVKKLQKFKTGDLIEFCDNNRICLGIISGYSGDKDRIQSIQLQKDVHGNIIERANQLQFDISDDSYVILYLDSDNEGKEGQIPHTHISSFLVFETKGFISDSAKATLKAAII
jgi:hypothetical protein